MNWLINVIPGCGINNSVLSDGYEECMDCAKLLKKLV